MSANPNNTTLPSRPHSPTLSPAGPIQIVLGHPIAFELGRIFQPPLYRGIKAQDIGCAKKQHFCFDPIGVPKKNNLSKIEKTGGRQQAYGLLALAPYFFNFWKIVFFWNSDRIETEMLFFLHTQYLVLLCLYTKGVERSFQVQKL